MDIHLNRRMKRKFRAQIRYTRIVFQEFRYTLMMFLVVLVTGTFLFHGASLRYGYLSALYQTFQMVFGQPVPVFPEEWHLQILAFVFPILGLTILAEGILRFSLLLFAKQHHQKEWTMALTSTYRNHTILVGLGNVGYRIYQSLKKLEADVIAIDKKEKSPFIDNLIAESVPVIAGDARNEEYLKQLQVEHARTLIAVTSDDLVNLEVCIDARRLNPNIRVFMRMFDQTFAKKIEEQFDFQFVFSTSALVAPVIAGMVTDPTVKNSYVLGDQVMVVAELEIREGSGLIGKQIKDLPMSVLSVTRDSSRMMFPSADLRVAQRDRIVLQTTPEHLATLHRLNGDKVMGDE